MRSDGIVGLKVGYPLRFAVIFALLIVPWPGWNEGYGQYFRSLGQWYFGDNDGSRMVVFARNVTTDGAFDTQISMGNRAALDLSGRGLIMRTEIDTRSIGWLPTALTMALVMATPIPWRRRVVALVAGLILIHVFIGFSLQTWIWDNSTDIGLPGFSPAWKRITAELSYAFLNQLGISFTVPVLIWILVTFQRRDVLQIS